jgi:uncharacterized protein
MTNILKSKELHLFKRLDKYLVFDVNELNLFEVNEEAYAILAEASGKSPRQVVDQLSRRFDRDAIQGILEQLLEVRLLGDDLPPPLDVEYEDELDFKGITLFVTQDCNLRCRYCLTSHDGNITKKYMSCETALQAVDLLFLEAGDRDKLSIGFFGGEPFLNFDVIRSTVEYADQKAADLNKTISYTITTNGTLINDEMASFFKKRNITIALSVDGAAEIHDSNRVFPNGKGTFTHVLEGIEALKAEGNFIGAVTVVSDRRHDFKEVVLPLLECGIDNVKIITALGKDGGIPVVDGEPAWYGRAYEELTRNLAEANRLFIEPPPINFPHTFKILETRKKPRSACCAAYGQVMVGPDGRIFPCENFIGRDSFSMGSLNAGFDRSLQAKFRSLAASNNPTCQACWARNVCGGWCPYYSWTKYKDLEKPVESMCIVKRSYLEVAMAAYSLYKSHVQQLETSI